MNPMDTDNLVLDSNFVRQQFYAQPPESNASPEEWMEWMKTDASRCRAAKTAHTRAYNKSAMESGQCGDGPEMSVRKVGGRYIQTSPVGFVGEGEEGQGHLEPTIEASQNKEVVMGKWEDHARGSKSKHKAQRRRANKK